MRTIPLAFVFTVALAATVRSQEPVAATDESATAPGVESPVTPAIVPAAARILGNIPDGTPPPPQPPKPVFVVPARNILATTARQQGGRTITFQKIKPIALPPTPEPPPQLLAAAEGQIVDSEENDSPSDMIMLGATVYRFKDSPPRTLLTYWPGGGGGCITCWSSADFALISGVTSFVATDGEIRSLFLMWSCQDIDSIAEMSASHGSEYEGPDIPDFPAGPATYSIVGTPPDAETLVPIQSLHDIYNSEYARLKAAWDGRERARVAREAWLKANPPQPKNIVLNYWRTTKPAAGKGGAK